MHRSIYHTLKNQKGVAVIYAAFLLFVFIGVGALSVDIANSVVARNELKNAADAGSLAGARFLYINDGSAVNTSANRLAHESAINNYSQKKPAENILATDVKRGHWSFGLGNLPRGFYENENVTAPPILTDRSMEELDQDRNFINAVWVRTRRDSTPVPYFLGRIFGKRSHVMTRQSVAYIGFAGTLFPSEVDIPFAICEDYITRESDGIFTCSYGRLHNSGNNSNHQTGGWTNFTQPCKPANASELKRILNEGNSRTITAGKLMGTQGGVDTPVINELIDKIERMHGAPQNQPFPALIPVINCTHNNVTSCTEAVGAVKVDILWATNEKAHPKKYDQIPAQMEHYSCADTSTTESRKNCWIDFVTEFDLKNDEHVRLADLGEAENYGFKSKTIYLKPRCDYSELAGGTGGENYGVLAKVPVLVDMDSIDF